MEGLTLQSAAGLTLAFTTSAVVLVLEILAGRMLAPYVGVTLQTYTGIIGVVLAGISLGSFLGGRMADRTSPRLLLGPIIAAGGLLAMAVPLAIDLVGPRIAPRSAVGIVTVAFAAFFPPALVLSAVTPIIAKLQLQTLTAAGRVVGRLSAVSTAGAIFGTFLSGFFLVAALPTRRTVIVVGLALVAVGVATWVLLARGLRRDALLIAVGAMPLALVASSARGPCTIESIYYCVKIQLDTNRASGRFLVMDDLLHSHVDLQDPTHLEFEYTRAVASAVDGMVPPDRPIRALHVGGGGFSLPRYLSATRASARNVVLEIDPRVVEADERYLGLRLGERIRVVIGDARMRIQEQPRASYDVVIGDAFASLSVPWHLTTVEFLGRVREVLKPDGTYVLNIIDFPPARFAKAKAATLAAAFPHVALIGPAQTLDGSTGGNYVFVASARPIDFEAIRAQLRERDPLQDIQRPADAKALAGASLVLRDDFAPVDQLIALGR